ncbi:MAG: response regulator [Clostridiales bacterium]|jgi:YesN/AraC family two-component response regulator|nr:response regulator [Clostridiales bacterium]MDR2752295.1 response regulator [Clostridiales bacterium]
MIRVMIVEDEPPIAQSIQLLTEAYDESVRVVHTAINGKRALDYLETERVDIIFSDVKMPIMDGLELSRILQERYPDVIMIIVSGFSEFEFARQAIQYGVSNYLLKPVSAQHIAEALQVAVEEVNNKREMKTRAILEGAVMRDQRPGFSEGQLSGVILMCGGAFPLVPEESFLGMRDLWNVSAMEKLLDERLGRQESGFCARGKSQLELAAVFPASDPVRIEEVSKSLFDHIGKANMAVTMAVWDDPVPLDMVAETFSVLRKRIHKHIRLFLSQLLMGDNAGKSSWDSGSLLSEALLALKSENADVCRSTLKEFVDSAVSQSARQRDFEICLERITLSHFGSLLTLEQLSELRYELQSAISTSLHPSELAEELSRIFEAWMSADQEKDTSKDKELCEKMSQFLKQNYKENIRCADLGRRFGYSSTQLAKKFKNCYGVSFSEFINNFRIELAKSIIQSNKKAMIKEVAVEVGFSDQYYFSKLFKKITGMWPTEYSRMV